MAPGPEQRIDPREGSELVMPQINRDSSQLADVGVAGTQAPVLDPLSFDQLSGGDVWHQSLVYPG
jgi:hypothetical protein